MDQIAAGKGRGPKPFMLDKKKSSQANAVWHSNRNGGHHTYARSETNDQITAPEEQHGRWLNAVFRAATTVQAGRPSAHWAGLGPRDKA